MEYPRSYFNSTEQAAALFDGLFVDAGGYSPWAYTWRNISETRYKKMYEGKMEMLRKAQANCSALNGGMVSASSCPPILYPLISTHYCPIYTIPDINTLFR
jgi:hypothetical protein